MRGVLSFHLLGPQTFLVRAGFFFLQAVLFLLSSSQQACPVIVLFHGNGAAGDCAHSTHKKKSVVAQSVLLPRSLMPGRSLCLQGGGLPCLFIPYSLFFPHIFLQFFLWRFVRAGPFSCRMHGGCRFSGGGVEVQKREKGGTDMPRDGKKEKTKKK